MEQIEFKIDGQVYEVEEADGTFSVVQDSVFIGQMYKEKDSGWSWESAEGGFSDNFPWSEIGKKIDKHIANMA